MLWQPAGSHPVPWSHTSSHRPAASLARLRPARDPAAAALTRCPVPAPAETASSQSGSADTTWRRPPDGPGRARGPRPGGAPPTPAAPADPRPPQPLRSVSPGRRTPSGPLAQCPPGFRRSVRVRVPGRRSHPPPPPARRRASPGRRNVAGRGRGHAARGRGQNHMEVGPNGAGRAGSRRAGPGPTEQGGVRRAPESQAPPLSRPGSIAAHKP